MQAQSGGLSAGGQNNRFNNIQIDGASESDIFGLGTTGQPGGQARGRSISLDAVKEYQVLLSPFDVRQGNFTGALINAVTKSGTNELHGSAYSLLPQSGSRGRCAAPARERFPADSSTASRSADRS